MPDDSSPTAEPLAIWEQMRPALLARIGEDKLAAIEATMGDARRFLAEPQTFHAIASAA